MNYDQLAVRYLLDGKPGLQALMREAAQAVGSECPECGSRDTEDNSASEYRCVACDHRWGFEYGERYGF